MLLCVTQAAKKLQAKELFACEMRENLNLCLRIESVSTLIRSSEGVLK